MLLNVAANGIMDATVHHRRPWNGSDSRVIRRHVACSIGEAVAKTEDVDEALHVVETGVSESRTMKPIPESITGAHARAGA